MQAFLLSRSILSGAGTLKSDSRFVLSEKGTGMKRLTRFSIVPGDRAVFG